MTGNQKNKGAIWASGCNRDAVTQDLSRTQGKQGGELGNSGWGMNKRYSCGPGVTLGSLTCDPV